MTQGLTAGGRQRIAGEEVAAWELEREDDIDEGTRAVIDFIMRTAIATKRKMRASRPALIQAVNGEASPG